ncbi:MAG: phage terminase large subunit [Pseudomonadota bacterium]
MSDGLTLFPDQLALVDLVAKHKFTCAYGSSRGGKSYTLFSLMVVRALAFKGSNHCVIRQTAASIPSTIWPTAMMVLKALAPGYREEIDVNSSNRCITLHNGSKIWFFGAQDDAAVEKIMGAEFATIFLNEIVNLDLKTYNKVITRLNANDIDEDGDRIDLKLLADCNPKSKAHWVYQIWGLKQVPDKEPPTPLFNPDAFGWMAFDRNSNPDVDASYYDELRNLSDEEQARFLDGEWYDESVGALFSRADLKDNRATTPDLDDFDLTVVAIDPAVSNNPDSDETGIFVAGAVGEEPEAHYYPIADLSGHYHPQEWATKAIEAYWRYGAKCIVVETTMGGNQNAYTLRSIDPRVSIVEVNPGRGQGKNERAKPIATLMRSGRIHHPYDDQFKELERQMLAMTGDYDRKRQKSPDRLDAYVYAISELLTGKGPVKPVVISKIKGWFS